MTTEKNLKEAFAGESQANRMYLAFAKKAESDGYPQVAKLFRAAAAAETVHAHAHFRVLGGVKETVANLQTAIDGEGHEFKEMYPGFLSEAEAEKKHSRRGLFPERPGRGGDPPQPLCGGAGKHKERKGPWKAGHLRLRNLRQYGVWPCTGQVPGLQRGEVEVHEDFVEDAGASFQAPKERGGGWDDRFPPAGSPAEARALVSLSVSR